MKPRTMVVDPCPNDSTLAETLAALHDGLIGILHTLKGINLVADDGGRLEVELLHRIGHLLALLFYKTCRIIFVEARIEREERVDRLLVLAPHALGDIADLLLDGERCDAVLPVVRELDGATALRLAYRAR